MPKRSSRPGKQARAAKAAAGQAPAVGLANEGETDFSSSAVTLRRLYAALLRCRRVQERLHSAFSVAATRYDIALGREAVTVGATAELTANDTIAATSRNLAARLAKGVSIGEILDSNGTNPGSARPTPFIPEDPFNAGVGIALAHRLEQKRGVVVALCTQPQPSLDMWRDALKFAVTEKLPIIFVIESSAEVLSPAPEAAQHLHALSFMVRDHNFPGILVDGCDAVAVWRVVQESIHRARKGLGPTLIDCQIDPTRDPLAHMEHYLRKRELWAGGWRQSLESEVTAAIAQGASRTPRSSSRAAQPSQGRPRQR